MSTDEAIRDATLDQRVVLLALLGASQDRSTPVNPAELRQVCNERLAGSDGPLAGGFSEADVTRALYSLESAGLVENVAEGDQSPAGKGRPAYELVPDAGSVRSALAADDTLEPLLEAVD
ncbi:MAG: hypothetical protein ABEH64_06400 [Salinirussus sp.]